MYCYRKTNGMAHDLRLVDDDYKAQVGEIVAPGSALPDIETLHDQEYIDAAKADHERLLALHSDIRAQELLGKLRFATPQQISDYVDNNVTDLASARLMFKRILLVVAVITRGRTGDG